jgi:hypothetical protein
VKPLYVRGAGFWTPGQASLASHCAGSTDEGVAKPEAALLAGPSKRRASLLTRMAIEVFAQAAAEGKADAASVPSVWAIVHGEICTAVDLMGMMHKGEGKLSPTKFHNSVYNTASGYASIASGNRAPSTTLTGGPEIVGSALVEAAGLLHEGARQVVVVWADEPHPPPFEAHPPRRPLALSLCVSNEEGDGALACLADLRREACAAEELDAGFEGMYVAAALPLLERIFRRQPGPVALEQGAEPLRWRCDLGF